MPGSRSPFFLLACLIAGSGSVLGVPGVLSSPVPALAQGPIVEVKPMARDAHPSFEVATIKRTPPDDQSSGFHTSGRRIFIENQTMRSMLAFAYSFQDRQIVGGPDWLATEHWDIDGLPDVEGQPGERQQQEMLRKLLAERFQLATHRDQRDMGIFTISALPGRKKLTENTSDSNLPDQTGSSNRSQQDWRFTANSMSDFAQFLQYFLDRPVVDHTGFSGKFDFRLKWATDESAEQRDPAVPGIYTAMREQLGLKLESTHGTVEVLSIDHAARPSVD